MSLAQLKSQIEDLRAQAATAYSRGIRTTDLLDADDTLSDVGKQKARDTEREQVNAKIRDLRKKETELIAAKKQSLERRLFGLGPVASGDPNQIIAYRDAQDRAARLTDHDDAQAAFAAAMRSDDRTLAAAILARALDAGWNRIVNEYVEQNPTAGEDLNDLADINQYSSFDATLSYSYM
ncbi:hypothetical protein ACJH6J_24700 [Mycobacterium sp. SMC-18]|uniref:hypothetical protein n=1 Tax=unclassified Mycobacterium TaxID=2642494 RepID=UPI00093F5D82|nr:hypothetical protein [Mycobacterium sp. ST-F2]OKH78289.1 hypothetical protein EB75_28080 [Mycobacterium sp. ST-F2]